MAQTANFNFGIKSGPSVRDSPGKTNFKHFKSTSLTDETPLPKHDSGFLTSRHKFTHHESIFAPAIAKMSKTNYGQECLFHSVRDAEKKPLQAIKSLANRALRQREKANERAIEQVDMINRVQMYNLACTKVNKSLKEEQKDPIFEIA